MRLWHKDLIKVLPRKQLMSQWRECCAIAKNIKVKGTPNHILVNKVMDYPESHFYTYSKMVYDEMVERGYKVNWNKFSDLLFLKYHHIIKPYELFSDWHNDRYYKQCYYNLQEKYDRGGISDTEWSKISLR